MKRLILALCLLGLTAPAAGAKDRELAFKPITGGFFALSTPNLAESVRWYSEKLGLAVAFEAPGPIAVTTLEGGGLIVELVHNPAAKPRGGSQPDLVHGPFKAGFVVKDFDRTVGELRARGVEIAFGPFPARDGQRANVLVRDNAANLIQIFGD